MNYFKSLHLLYTEKMKCDGILLSTRMFALEINQMPNLEAV